MANLQQFLKFIAI